MAKRLTVSYLDERPEHAVDGSRPRDFAVPYLRMRGKWLERLGFAIGTKLRVESEPGRLVLTALPPSAPSPPAAGASEVCEPGPED